VTSLIQIGKASAVDSKPLTDAEEALIDLATVLPLYCKQVEKLRTSMLAIGCSPQIMAQQDRSALPTGDWNLCDVFMPDEQPDLWCPYAAMAGVPVTSDCQPPVDVR